MKRIYYSLFLGLFCVINHFCYAQDRRLADSLVQIILNHNPKDDKYKIFFSQKITQFFAGKWKKETDEQLEYVFIKLKDQMPCDKWVNYLHVITWHRVRIDQSGEQGIEFSNQILEKLKASMDICCQTEINQYNHRIARYFKQNQKAFEYLNQAIATAEKYHCHEKRVWYWLEKARLQEFVGNKDSMMAAYYEAIRLADILPVKSIVRAKPWEQFAYIHYQIKNYRKAEAFWRKAEKHYREIGAKNDQAKQLNDLALAIEKDGRIEQALAAYDTALQHSLSIKDTAWIGIVLGNIGKIYFEQQKQYAKAIPYLQQNATLGVQTRQWGSAAQAYIRIGHCFTKLGKFKEAKSYIDSVNWLHDYAMNIQPDDKFAEYVGLYVMREEALAEWYLAQGLYKEAEEHRKKQLEFYKELEESQSKNELNRIQTELDVERKEKENLLLKQQTEADQAEIERQKITNLIAVGFVIFLIGLALFFYKIMQQRKRLNEQLVSQKEEINTQKEILHQQNEQLEQLNSTKNRLFAIISHDLRSPINNLKGVVEIIDMDLPKEQQKQILQDTSRLMDNTFQTLENLLNWAKWQMGGVQYFPQMVDIQDISYQICSLFSQTAASKKISLENEILEKTEVWADRDHVELILRNLIGNALKFTPEGGTVILKSEIFENQIRICVSDSGVGISEDQLAKLFDNQQISSTRGTAGEKGTGLGLMMCKEFVEKNGGILTVNSKIDQGTAFCIILPTAP